MKKMLKSAMLICLTVFVLLSIVSCKMLSKFIPFEDSTTPQTETTAESTPDVTTPDATTPEETPPEEPVPESIAVAEAWDMLYNATSIVKEMNDRVCDINAELEKRYNVSLGVFYDPTTSGSARPGTNLLDFATLLDDPNLNSNVPGSGVGVINRYIYTQRTSDDTYYNHAINLVKTQFDKLKDSAVFFAQSTADLQTIIEKANKMEVELLSAYNLIKTTPLYNDREDVRAALLEDATKWMSDVSSIAQAIETNANLYLTTEGKDFLNKESDCYFLPKMQEALDFYFNVQFAEGGDYYEYYKEGGQYYTDYNNEKANAEQYPVDLVQIQRDLKKECPLGAFDEENIWAQVQNSN